MNAMHEREHRHGGKLVAGVILIALGGFFLLFNLGMVEWDLPWEWWPLILVAIGAGRLVTARGHDDRRGGLWMILIGAWLLINFLNLFGLGWHNSWPLMIIAAGGMIVWQSLSRPAPPRRSGAGEAGGEER